MMSSIQSAILRTLAGHSAGLPAAEIAHQLGTSVVRIASALYAAGQRGHVVRLDDSDGESVFSITPSGIDALSALDILAQRMDEKRHPATRPPPPESQLTQVRRAANAQRLKHVPEIDPRFALKIARILHKSNIPLDSHTRKTLSRIVQEAA